MMLKSNNILALLAGISFTLSTRPAFSATPPFLGNIANTCKRQELAEAILVPNKSIAQGFVANQFILKNGAEHEGFVIQEAADKVVIRNVAAQEIQIATTDISERRKSEKSLMPEGLAANLTVTELASLLDYLARKEVKSHE